MMSILKKIRQIFASNAAYQERGTNKLMIDAPWAGVYDRSKQPKDIHGSVKQNEHRK